jgi:hypothetical protein
MNRPFAPLRLFILERSISTNEKGKSCIPSEACTIFEFVSWGWDAELAHEILYVIVHDKAQVSTSEEGAT